MYPFVDASIDAFAGPSPAPCQPPSLAQWERLTQRGCSALQAGRTELALFSFHQALSIAQDLLLEGPAPPHADDCLAALVVSHHQLADLCANAQLLEQAANHLCRAHGAVMGLLQTPTTCLALQQAAWRHSRETHAELLQYQRRWGPHAGIARLLRASAEPAAGSTVH